MADRDHTGDVLGTDPTDFSLEELYDILAGRSQRLPPVVALEILRRKRYPEEEKVNDLRRILLDESASSRLRTAAGVALGRLATPAAREVLATQRESKLAVVSRAARLGLRETGPLQGATRREMAREMARPPGSPLQLDPDKAEPITHRKSSERLAERIARDLQEESPELALDPATARTLRCAGRTLAFVATRAAAEVSAIEKPPDSPVITGVVAAKETVETDRWTVRYILLTGPGEEPGTLALRLMRESGRVVMSGEATLEGNRATFTLRAVAGPGNAPAEVVGTYRPDGRLRLSEARSEPGVARQLAPERR